jgi:hypothetical protein
MLPNLDRWAEPIGRIARRGAGGTYRRVDLS